MSAWNTMQSLSYYSGYEIIEIESESQMTGCEAAIREYAIRVIHKSEEGERNDTIFEET